MNLRKILIAAILPFFILAVWEWAVQSGALPQTLVASPSQVFVDFFQLLFSGQLIEHSIISLFRLLSGFILGSLVGVVLGAWVGTSKLSENLIAPTLQFIIPIPPIAWIPLLIVLFGIGELSKIVLIFIASFIIVYFNTFQGVRSTSQKLVDLARVYKKSTSVLVGKILLPSAAPQIFTGLRVALGLSWVLLLAAEMIASSKGLGWLIWDARNFSRPDDLFVGIIAIGILGKVSDMILMSFEARVTHWQSVFKGQ